MGVEPLSVNVNVNVCAQRLARRQSKQSARKQLKAATTLSFNCRWTRARVRLDAIRVAAGEVECVVGLPNQAVNQSNKLCN